MPSRLRRVRREVIDMTKRIRACAGAGGQAAPTGGWTNTYDWGDYIG